MYLSLKCSKICPIQYNKGNLDKEFQREDKCITYSVITNDNEMMAVSNIDVMDCSWDSHLAFSVATYVDQLL